MAELDPEKIRRLADEEATRAEAEQPESDEEGEEGEQAEPGATPEPGPEPSPEEEEQNARLGELEKAQTAYQRKVAKVMGGELPWPECPVCHGVGFDLTGGQPEPEYLDSPMDIQCPDCQGWGKVKTGSRVENEDILACPTCQGSGHVAKGVTMLQQPPGQQLAPAAAWQGDPSIRPSQG